MFFTWHPRLGTHIIKQYFNSWLCVLAGMSLVYIFPFALQFIVHPYPLPDWWFGFHNFFILFALFITWMGVEFSRIIKTDKLAILVPNHIKSMVAELAYRASLRSMPRVSILMTKRWRSNAAVIQRTFSRSEIFLGDNMPEILNEREMYAVLAHEISHVKHRDQLLRIFFAASIFVFWSYILMSAVITIAALYVDTPPIRIGYIASKAVFLSAWWYVLVKLLFLSHSRACEYLTDAALVNVAGWSYRKDFLSALIKMGKSARPPFLKIPIFHSKVFEFLSTHPLTKNRAKALGMRIEVLPDGSENIIDEEKPLA